MRGPDFASRNRSSFATRSISSHLSVRISLLRQPLNINSRIAATACGHGGAFDAASRSAAPSRRYCSGVRNRSRVCSR